MKKTIRRIAFFCLLLAFFNCASKPSASSEATVSSGIPASGGMPPNIANARRNAPEDVLVGIGNAKMGTVAQSRNIAAARARAEISNSMDSLVKNMVHDYTSSSEVDPKTVLSFQENITVTLSKSDLSGAVIKFEEPDSDGQWWVVMHLSKANVVKEITQAQTAAKLAVPAMASFDAERRMNEAFEQLKKEGY